jgi:transposase, IS5 family
MPSLADLIIADVCPTHRFLEEMTHAIPWTLFEKQLTLHIHHKTGGRPPYPRLLLFKMSLLKTWFCLSDAQTEFQCRDRLSFRKFLGLSIDDSIPEATTLENFRQELRETGLDVGLIDTLDDFFNEQGILLTEGNLVDASFIRANCRPKKDPEAQSDLDADHGHKGFGYSATVNVDRGTKLIRRANTTSERPHDSQQMEAVIVGDEQEVFGDTAYACKAEWLEAQGIKARMTKKRARKKKWGDTPPLSFRDQYLNKVWAGCRAPVEHIFACWKTVFGVRRTVYRGLEHVNGHVQALALAYNLRRWGYLTRGECV